MAKKLEFGSKEWVDTLGQIAKRLVEGVDLSGIEFGFCEEYTDPPSSLGRAGSKAGLTLRIRNGALDVSNDVQDDVDTKITVDYQSVLPLARTVFGNDPAKAEEAKKQAEALAAAGKMRTDGGKRPSELIPELAALHDEIAKLTA